MRKSQSDGTRFKRKVGKAIGRSIKVKALNLAMFAHAPRPEHKSGITNPEWIVTQARKTMQCKFCACELPVGIAYYHRPKQGRIPNVNACIECGGRVAK